MKKMGKKNKGNLGKCTTCGELNEKTIFCNALQMSRKGLNCVNCDIYQPRSGKKLSKPEISTLRKGNEISPVIKPKKGKIDNDLMNRDYKDYPIDTDPKHWMNEDD